MRSIKWQSVLTLVFAAILIAGFHGALPGFAWTLFRAPAAQAEPAAAETADIAQPDDVPGGAVMFFDLPACPTGWTPLTAAEGRYLVGLNAQGTRGATVGVSLADREERASVADHTHAITETGHTHMVNETAHSHTLNDPGHTHTATVTDPGHDHPIYDPMHNHSTTSSSFWKSQGTANTGSGTARALTTGAVTVNVAETGIDVLNHTTGVSVAVAKDNADITVNSASTGVSVRSAETGVAVEPAGSAATNAPYLQLLVCKRDLRVALPEIGR